MVIRAIGFDLDQTLVPRERAFAGFLQAECANAAGRPLDLARVAALDLRGHGPKEPLLAYLAAALGWPERDHDARHRRFVAGMLAALQPDPRVTALLARLGARFPLALVSNGTSRAQRGKLAKLCLEPYFELVLISEEVGCKKPDPRMFTPLLAAWQLPAAEIAFVGDDPRKDVEGARGVGLTPIWIAEGRAWPLPSPAPSSLESVLALEALLEGPLRA